MGIGIAAAIMALLLALMIAALFIDLLPIARDWVSRIRIGKYDDRKEWAQAVTRIGVKWLDRTPAVRITDNTRWVLLDMLQGNYASRTIQHWQEASLLLGLGEHPDYQHDPQTAEAIRTFLDRTFTEYGRWREPPRQVDGAILAYAVMKLSGIDTDKYRPAFDETWKMIQDHIGDDGTVMYRKKMKDYRYVDTIGFICPFLVMYGLRYNKDQCIQLAVHQILTYEKHGIHETFHIPCHAYNTTNNVPLGLYGWGRGLGWYAIGLIDAWGELPDRHVYKRLLTDSVRRFAVAVIQYQQPQGCWNWIVTRPETRADSSATATLAWFLLNASRIKEIRDVCLKAADRATAYLMSVTRRSGAVDFSQSDTKDIGVYSGLFNILPFTQGTCIRAIHKIGIQIGK